MLACAAVLHRFHEPLILETIPVPALAPGQALVEVVAAGVCGSDVHMWEGRDPRTPLPMILGHEGVGRLVESHGPRWDVYGRPLTPGDLVLWERGVTCGACHACVVLHEPALCAQRWVYGIHRSLEVAPHLNGCYATHLVLDARTPLLALEPDDDPALLVSATCSGATAAHGFALSPARVGDTVVVFGPGPVGIYSTLLAAASGAEGVVVIGGAGVRLDFCARVGATHLLNRRALSAEQRREAVFDLTHGLGADLVVEASGSLAAAREALDLVRQGGAVSFVGFGTPVGELSLPPFETMVRKNVRVQGVWVSNLTHTLQAVSLVRQHRQALQGLVTHRFTLDQATAALQAVNGREAIKAVLLPNG
jgi:threonine dehydrogenase-like Zn-dependent dehydrogenase